MVEGPQRLVSIFKCLPIFAWWDFQGLYSLGLAFLKLVGKYAVTVTKAELGECILLLKMLPKQSVRLIFSCRLPLPTKNLQLLRLVNKSLGGEGSIFHRNMKKDCNRCQLYFVCVCKEKH